MRISDARLTSASVTPNDSLGFANINAFIVSFASDNEDVSMQEAAVKNPLEEGATAASLNVAPDAELGEIMEEGKVYVILDADLAEDYWDGNRDFKLNFTLELTIK
jgi:dihydroxyacetone kinase DhaKLM complex PTS-EIIA-like component DhaM